MNTTGTTRQTSLLYYIQLTTDSSLLGGEIFSMSISSCFHVRIWSIICPGKHTEKNPKAHTINLNFLFNLAGKNQAGERKVKYQVINIHLEETFIHLFRMDQGSHWRISLAMIDDPSVQVIFWNQWKIIKSGKPGKHKVIKKNKIAGSLTFKPRLEILGCWLVRRFSQRCLLSTEKINNNSLPPVDLLRAERSWMLI